MDDRKTHRRGPFHVIAAIIMGIIVAAAVSLVTAVFVMLLWNWLMPSIFGLAVIGYWKAFGLSLLAKLLLGGFAKQFPGPGPRKWPGPWKEFGDYRGKFCNGKHFDDVYEDWWQKEGSKNFEDYLKKDKNDAGGSEEK
jgi:hypothetical protein